MSDIQINLMSDLEVLGKLEAELENAMLSGKERKKNLAINNLVKFSVSDISQDVKEKVLEIVHNYCTSETNKYLAQIDKLLSDE